MKLYKGDKVMQLVDKDQVEICLEAGWSRTEPEVEVEDEEDEEEVPVAPKKISVPKKKKKK